MTTISVVVPATDRPATLPRCTAALDRAAATAGPVEIVVVNGPPGLGVCAARNTGADRAGGDVLVFVDSDVEVHTDALARIRAAFADDPGLTAVFGSYDDAPPGGTVAAFRNLLHHHVHHRGAGPASTFWSGLGAIRRDAFLAAGGFDGERFPHPSIEDVDLGARLVADGARIVLDPAIQGTHLKAWTLRSMVRTDFARRGVPWVALLLRSGQLRDWPVRGRQTSGHAGTSSAATALNLGLAASRERSRVRHGRRGPAAAPAARRARGAAGAARREPRLLRPARPPPRRRGGRGRGRPARACTT